MPDNYLISYRLSLFAFLAILAAIACAPQTTLAHQQPTTIVLLDVNPDKVSMELQIPLNELELAFGRDVSQNTDHLIERLSPQIKDYLLAHVHPATLENQLWSLAVTNMELGKAEQTQSGPYQEIKIFLDLTPPNGATTRQFVLNYDVIMHQVVTHKALVGIRQDWESGKIGEQPATVGIIAVDTATTKIFPLEINLQKGSSWEGFKGMVALGMRHILDGTDHLLFLLVLLLPATLLVDGRRWGNFGGAKLSVARLLKIVTAFTVGHSITLLLGAAGVLQMSQKPIEILIAVSILVSAVHAVRPIFAGKEMFIAAGFGLIHGLAFAAFLSAMNLHSSAFALSVFGFNVGIELMQIFIIAVVTPWIILLSLTPVYKWFRIAGAMLAAGAATAWITERVSGEPNKIGSSLQHISEYAPFGILILALVALLAFGLTRNKAFRSKITAY